MPRLWFTGLLVAVVAGGWYFITHYEIEGVESIDVRPRTGDLSETSQASEAGKEQPPVPKGRNTIRVATANLGPFDQQKLNKPQVADRLAEVIRRFDVVAIQDVRARDQGILVEFVEQVNSDGRHYDFATPPSVGRDLVEQYSAFLFDRATIEIDRGPGSKAIFEAEIVQLMDRGDGLRPKPVLGAGASPVSLSRAAPEGPLAGTVKAAGAPFNKLGLIITRVDAGEKLDPVGAYTITIRP